MSDDLDFIDEIDKHRYVGRLLLIDENQHRLPYIELWEDPPSSYNFKSFSQYQLKGHRLYALILDIDGVSCKVLVDGKIGWLDDAFTLGTVV